MHKKIINKLLTLLKITLFAPYHKYRLHQNNKLSIQNYKDSFQKNDIQQATTSLETLALQSSASGISEKENTGKKLLISLTSHKKRIEKAFLTIESLFQQSVKADKIILWLSETEFRRDNIPETLKSAEKRGLTIEFCKDIGPYTKLIPTLIKHPDDLIITVDDDILYPPDMTESLFAAHKERPDIIHCHRARKIALCEDGELECYNNWESCSKDYMPSLMIFPLGVAGVLYFPGCFHEDIINYELFLKLTPCNDDLWFKSMSLLKNVKCGIIEKQDKLMMIKESQVNGLWIKNKDPQKGNNINITAVFNHYKELRNITKKWLELSG